VRCLGLGNADNRRTSAALSDSSSRRTPQTVESMLHIKDIHLVEGAKIRRVHAGNSLDIPLEAYCPAYIRARPGTRYEIRNPALDPCHLATSSKDLVEVVIDSHIHHSAQHKMIGREQRMVLNSVV